MSAISSLHNIFFRRSSAYALTIVGAAFFFERGFDIVTEYAFEQMNKGKMWKHIKHRYVE